ncbi:MAG: potassium channel protein [Bacteroidetes bacterium HGW-Bacteroidetes-17]|jgi:voltage-gated potassium channel|nr:MAG: potassium channel protein [Bacteroidetes bacterium HGW-Bacteroidetes-17]
MEVHRNKTKLTYAVLLLILLMTFGILGFILIEDFNLLDSVYMTIITVSTVGFGEVQPLSSSGKMFTSILILLSLGVLTYVVSIITTQFFEGQLSHLISGYKNNSRRKKMENHVIICGYGRNGQQAVKELVAHKKDFIVIDSSHDLIMGNSKPNYKMIEGDATNDEILLQASILTVRALISTLPNDADNLFVTLTARSLNSKIKIISRASNESSEKKLKMAGADNVVMPERVGGAHMATLVARPDVTEFLENLSVHGTNPTNLEEIDCDDLPKNALNKTIFEIGVRQKTGANIIGFKTPEGEFILNPNPEIKITPNSKLFVLGTKDQIAQMREILNSIKKYES